MAAFCSSCGSALTDGVRFCPSCGATVGGQTPVPPAAAGTPQMDASSASPMAQAPARNLEGHPRPDYMSIAAVILFGLSPIILTILVPQTSRLMSFSTLKDMILAMPVLLVVCLAFSVRSFFRPHISNKITGVIGALYGAFMLFVCISVVPNAIKYVDEQPKKLIAHEAALRAAEQRIDAETNKAGKH